MKQQKKFCHVLGGSARVLFSNYVAYKGWYICYMSNAEVNKGTCINLNGNLLKQRAMIAPVPVSCELGLTSHKSFCCVGVTLFFKWLVSLFGHETSPATQQMLHGEICQLRIC